MILVLFSAMVAAATAAFTWRLAAGDDRWRFAALYAGGICLVIGALLTVGAFERLRYTCDEGCIGPGYTCDQGCSAPRWSQSPDAWQWHALPVLATAGLACVALAVLLVAVRRYRAGFAAFAAALVPFVPFSLLMFGVV